MSFNPRTYRGLPWLMSLAIVIASIAGRAAAQEQAADVVIYGATSAGIAAAIAAAKGGHSVLLAEPTIRIGGMVTNGLSHPDFRSFQALNGTYLELNRRVLDYYTDEYGADSRQVQDCFRGTHAEPKVNLLIFQRMLVEHPQITVKTEWILADAYTRGPAGDRRVRAVRFRDANGEEHLYAGKIFVDATYEGDLIAAAQIPYRLGVESRDEYGESAAPVDSSSELQGYNFRLIMTREPDNRVTLTAPKGYRREDFAGLLPLIAEGKIKQAFGGYGDRDNVVKAQIPILPNGKRDINDVSRGYVRLSLPGDQLMWPEGDAAIRKQIYDEHLLWNVGLIYFLQNDPEVPEGIQNEAREWGFCRDEFVESNHIPPQLYVREARRMLGQRIFTQHDTRHAEGDARAILHPDAVAIGEYGHSSHGTRHEGSRFGGTRYGEGLGVVYAPYQIPYGTIVPKDVRNLLAPVPASSSHVGFCALRLEPIWTSMGQAAGHAADLALRQEGEPDVRTVDVPRLQRQHHADGGATIYVSDVLPGDENFAAVQWWGTAGGLHGLAPTPTGTRLGKNIQGQHNEAWLGHEAQLDLVLDSSLADRWLVIAREQGLDSETLPRADGKTTRGEWINAAFVASRQAGELSPAGTTGTE